MLPLYKRIYALLAADTTLKGLLGGDEVDPRIYQTFVQFHSEAALRGKYWVTFNKVQDVADETQQTNVIRDIRFEVHSWGRDTDSDQVDQIEDRIRAILDNVDLNNTDLLAWFCLQDGPSSRIYEVDQKVWHGISIYRCRVADRAELPS